MMSVEKHEGDEWEFSPCGSLGFWLIHKDIYNYRSPGISTLDHSKIFLFLDSYHTYWTQRKQTISKSHGGNHTTICCIFVLWSNAYHLCFSLVYVDREFSFDKFQAHFLFLATHNKTHRIRKQKLWFQNGN